MVTAPMVFVVAGFIIGAGGLGVASIDVGHSGIHLIAELTLILVCSPTLHVLTSARYGETTIFRCGC